MLSAGACSNAPEGDGTPDGDENATPQRACTDARERLSEMVYARHATFTGACGDDFDCRRVGTVSGGAARTCFYDCKLSLPELEVDAFRNAVADDVELQQLCLEVTAGGCDVDPTCASPWFTGFCLRGQCASPGEVDRAFCNDELRTVYAAVEGYIASLNFTCTTDDQCTALSYDEFRTCGYDCGIIVPADHAEDITAFVKTDPTVTQHCQVAHDAACLIESTHSCPYRAPRCIEGQCTRVFPSYE